MSDDDESTLNQGINLSDDDNTTASLGSRVSDDSGIEDWSDDMAIQPESQDDMLPKDFPGEKSIPELIHMPISPIKEESSSECYSTVELPAICDSFRKDVLDDSGISGICGLHNLGNTCFMNAALQCIFVTSALKNLVLEGDILQNGSNHMDEPANVLLFVERFQELFLKVLSGKYSLLHPDQLHLSVARLHSAFGDYKQHDSQEFISFLLNTLHDLLNKTSPSKKLCLSSNGEPSLKASHLSQYTSEDMSENITGDVAKRLKMDIDIVDDKVMEPDAGVECEENLSKSESAWREYTADNQSIIIDSFQGQFQSVIICEKCAFISTTYEPFMFLSLPIPHAMEKQLVISWIPSKKLSPLPGMVSAVKYCVTVKKDSCILDAKKAFLSLVKKNDPHINMADIILAEVDRCANVNILDDRTQIAYLSKTKNLYAIEIMRGYQQNSLASSSHQSTSDDNFTNNINGICTNESNEEADEMLNDNTKFNSDNAYELGLAPNDIPESMTCDDVGNNCIGTSAAAWHSCGICLEETFDEELKVHLICGGTLCDTCLTRLVQGNKQLKFSCPICNRYISFEDYTPLVEPQKNGDAKKCVRQIMVPIMLRHDSLNNKEHSRKFNLFGHPIVCSLPSQVDSSTILQQVDQVLRSVSHIPAKFDVVVTDAAGLSCGLCDLMSSCTGCQIKGVEQLQLKPGSCLSIHFHDTIDLVVKTMNMIHEDKSMKELRESDSVFLKECLSKFGDTEVLTDENPWFCPQCQTNQNAVKNMTVTRWPDTLIIHLKRFSFEGRQGCKIGCPVEFPLNDLNVDMLSCADGYSDSLKLQTTYDLYAFICHSGTLFGGHYTAMSKVNPSADWHLFNDESFQKMMPSDEHNEEGYVLFYQRKGS